jgi:hemolysin activation/secretion protein
MDVLRNLFGSLTSGIIRLAVAVGIIAAIGIFLVKPVVESANHAVDSANQSFEKSFGSEFDAGDIDKTLDNANRQIQIQVKQAFHASKRQGHAGRLIRCIRRAHQNVNRIQRCSEKFSP